jgi:hypothetical protein
MNACSWPTAGTNPHVSTYQRLFLRIFCCRLLKKADRGGQRAKVSEDVLIARAQLGKILEGREEWEQAAQLFEEVLQLAKSHQIWTEDGRLGISALYLAKCYQHLNRCGTCYLVAFSKFE